MRFKARIRRPAVQCRCWRLQWLIDRSQPESQTSQRKTQVAHIVAPKLKAHETGCRGSAPSLRRSRPRQAERKGMNKALSQRATGRYLMLSKAISRRKTTRYLMLSKAISHRKHTSGCIAGVTGGTTYPHPRRLPREPGMHRRRIPRESRDASPADTSGEGSVPINPLTANRRLTSDSYAALGHKLPNQNLMRDYCHRP